MNLVHISRHFRPSSLLATVLCVLCSYNIALAQEPQAAAGSMNIQRNDAQRTHQAKEINPGSASVQHGMSKEDSNMLRSMAKSNIAEIQLSGLAQAVSESRIVHEYAQRMLDDHSRALQHLREIAAANGVVIPGGPDEEHVLVARELAVLKGDEFNDKFLAHAGIEAHQKSLQLYQDASKQAQDTALKSYAEKTVATINQHLKMANAAQQAYATAQKRQK